MMPAFNSPRVFTLGSQFVAISLVFAFIARMLLAARRPEPAKASSKTETTQIILVRIANFMNMTGSPTEAQRLRVPVSVRMSRVDFVSERIGQRFING